jgi:hypothetical protein
VRSPSSLKGFTASLNPSGYGRRTNTPADIASRVLEAGVEDARARSYPYDLCPPLGRLRRSRFASVTTPGRSSLRVGLLIDRA